MSLDIDIIHKIKSAVINQLNGAYGLYSLKIQNHIYGCFIIMEDIAQKAVGVSGTVLHGDKFSFDFDKQFSEIGIRYGFVMDTKLLLDTFTAEYKEVWVSYFKGGSLDLSLVDRIEDCILEIIQRVRPSDAFFLNAIETGSLTQEWIGIAIDLLHSPVNTLPMLNAVDTVAVTNTASNDIVKRDAVTSDAVKSDAVKSDAVKSDAVKSDAVKSDAVNNIVDNESNDNQNRADSDDDVKVSTLNSAISHAKTEKPIHRHRRLEITRRNKSGESKDSGHKQLVKKSLAKTRRLHHS